MIRWLFILGIVGVLAFCGATVPLGSKTFFGHIGAIWGSKEATELKEEVKKKAEPIIEKGGKAVKGAAKELAKDEIEKEVSGSDAKKSDK